MAKQEQMGLLMACWTQALAWKMVQFAFQFIFVFSQDNRAASQLKNI